MSVTPDDSLTLLGVVLPLAVCVRCSLAAGVALDVAGTFLGLLGVAADDPAPSVRAARFFPVLALSLLIFVALALIVVIRLATFVAVMSALTKIVESCSAVP